MWYQKSRTQWIRDGDRKTRFSHLSTLVRRKRDKVLRLKIDGEWVDDSDQLKQHAVNFYKILFDDKEVLPLSDPLYR